jgi:HEPN domain-containing protein
MEFVRDPSHWLRKFSPDEWVRAALAELRRAEARFKANDMTAGLAGCKRAAGMALNGALLVEPNESWARSYVDHVTALGRDASIPERVRDACKHLLEARPPSSDILTLRSRRSDERLLEAARDVMAHAYAVVKRHENEGE